MKATRFLNTVFRFGVLTALVTLVSTVSLAQVTLPASTASTQFGRLSWSSTFNNFDGITFTTPAPPYQLSFGAFGQANDQTTANPNGHGFLSFGLFGYSGKNGLFGAAAHSVVAGAARNVGMWALASNASAASDLTHGSADTNIAGLAVGLEVGAGGGAGALGHSGVAILVDSGDVHLDAGNNTTTVKNFKVYGTFQGGNDYTQALSTDAVTSTPITTAVLEADVTGGTNANPAIKATSASTSGTVVVLTDNNSTPGTLNSATTVLSATTGTYTGYGTKLDRNGNGKIFQLPGVVGRAPDAALEVTRGADIDTLNISGQLQFSSPATVDFKGAKIKNMSGNNLFTQVETHDDVTISASTNAGVEIQMTPATANSDPALLANTNATATGDLLELEKGGTDVFTVANNGDLTIGASKFTVTASSGATNAAGDFTVATSKFKVASADGAITVNTASPVFTVSGTGQTAITDATTSGTSLTITQSNGAAKALSVTSHNDASFGTRIDKAYEATASSASFTIPTGPLVPSNGITTGSASLVVNRGAIIDTLDVSGHMEFGNTTQKATVNFSNAIVTGLTTNDTSKTDFHTGNPQENATTNTAIWVRDSGATTAGFITLDSGNVGSATTKFSVNGHGNTTINVTTGSALTVTGPTAITIDGGIKTNGVSNQPAGGSTGTILIGTRSITVTVSNTLATTASNIVVSARPGTGNASGDSYSAQVVSRSAGSFDVKISCIEGDVPAAEAIAIDYWIVN